MSEIEESIYQTNTSADFNKLISMSQEKIIEINLLDPLSKVRIKIPIRHRNYNSKCCLFDMESFVGHLKEENIKKDQQVRCTQCQNNMDVKDYGVHYDLYHYMEVLKQTAFNNGFKFESVKKMYFDRKQQQYLVQVKDRQSNDLIQIYLPKGKDSQAQNQIENQQSIIQEVNNYFQVMHEYYKKSCKHVKNRKQLATQIRELFHINPFKFKQYGKSHYDHTKNKQITFNIFQEIQNKYLMTVYYVECKFYRTYELDAQYKHAEYATYYKDSNLDPEYHTIFVMGGMTNNYECTNKFVKILVPKQPVPNNTTLKIISLFNLPSAGINFHTFLLEQKFLMIFNGQIIFVKENTVEKQYLKAYWEYNIVTNQFREIQQNSLAIRYDGTSFVTSNQLFPLAIFGGIKHNPEGRLPLICEPSKTMQCYKSSIKSITNEVNLQYQGVSEENKNSFSYPMFVIPYINDQNASQIVLYSSEILKQKLVGSRMAYILDLNKGIIKFSSIHTMNVPDIILTPSQIEINKKDFKYYNPIQDQQGASLDGVFYTIMQQRDSKSSRKTIINLISINQVTGKFTRHDYQKQDPELFKHPDETVIKVI